MPPGVLLRIAAPAEPPLEHLARAVMHIRADGNMQNPVGKPLVTGLERQRLRLQECGHLVQLHHSLLVCSGAMCARCPVNARVTASPASASAAEAIGRSRFAAMATARWTSGPLPLASRPRPRCRVSSRPGARDQHLAIRMSVPVGRLGVFHAANPGPAAAPRPSEELLRAYVSSGSRPSS